MKEELKSKISEVQQNLDSNDKNSEPLFEALYNEMDKHDNEISDDLIKSVKEHLNSWEQNHPEAVKAINAISDILAQLGI